MSKLNKLFQFLVQLGQQPSLVNLILNRNENWKQKVERKYGKNPELPQVELDQLLPDFAEQLEVVTFLGGGSMVTDMALLKGLCKTYENCRYFEIGTWRGESVANVASVAKECFTLNLSKEEILAKGYDQAYADLHAVLSKNLPNVTHLLGDSMHFDFAQFDQKFDVIFIDGNHHHHAVISDTQNVLKHLIHPNSTVVWHDYAYSPEEVRYEVLDAILKAVPNESHSKLYHVANTKCAVLLPKKYDTKQWVSPAKPEKIFQVSISLNS